VVGPGALPKDAAQWGVTALAFVGGWLITLFVNLGVGALALHLESSVKVMDVWLSVYFVLSGYIVPVELFPAGIRAVADALPFRYQVGLPTELFTNLHTPSQAMGPLAAQWGWVLALFLLTWLIWRTGLRRFAAYGG
jgi:ABC-2 type transport system permease protein